MRVVFATDLVIRRPTKKGFLEARLQTAPVEFHKRNYEGGTLRVEAEIEEAMLQGDYREIEGVRARCSKCGHEVESFGTGEGSIKRCLALLREECPERERNFYVADDPY